MARAADLAGWCDLAGDSVAVEPMTSKATLRRYGLTADAYYALLDIQGGVCPICKVVPSRPVVDHEHVKGWSRMKPEKRRQYVRGICCWRCNRFFLGKGISVERACNLADYLLAYQNRRRTF